MKHQNSTLLLLVFFLFLLNANAASELSNQAKISILTCSPGDEAYSVYGHSAIRVYDPLRNYDAVFNYGIFDFSSSNFIFRFAKGETDYLLGVNGFNAFVDAYIKEKRSVYEQELNLTQSEKQQIFDFLQWNARPENRVYRYNFFFDNCATRVRDVINENIEGGVNYTDTPSEKTFRRLITDYQQKIPWLNFGIDFMIGADADRKASLQEEMFLPDYVMQHLAAAQRVDTGAPIVSHSKVIYKAPDKVIKQNWWSSPFAVFGFLLLLVLVVSIQQFRKRNLKPALDLIIYGINGFAGIFIFWFVLFSEHPAMSPNFNLLWLFPLNFVFALIWLRKKWRVTVKYYHFFSAVWLLLFFALSVFLPQKFHPVFYVMSAILWIRSVFHSLIISKELKVRN
jgi:hypothetical protein